MRIESGYADTICDDSHFLPTERIAFPGVISISESPESYSLLGMSIMQRVVACTPKNESAIRGYNMSRSADDAEVY